MVVLHTRSRLLIRDTNTDDPNATHAPLFIAATAPFVGLAMFFYCARMYSRTVPTIHLYWDDYIVSLAFVSCVQLSLDAY